MKPNVVLFPQPLITVHGELETPVDDLERQALEILTGLQRLADAGHAVDMNVFGVLCDTVRLARKCCREGAEQ